MSDSNTPPPPPGDVPPPPPPPPAESSGEFQGSSDRYSIGDAFNYGWSRFQKNLGNILLAVIIYVVIGVVISVIWYLIVGAITRGMAGGEPGIVVNPDGTTEITNVSTGGIWLTMISMALSTLVIWLITLLIQAGITRAALAITYGRSFDLKTLFSTDRFGVVVVAALIVAILTSIGAMLCYIPGLIVGFFAQFFLFFLIDKNMGAWESIKASFSFVNKNLATLIGFYIASMVAYFIGALLCGIGLIVAIPVVVIAQAYTYRKLNGESVA